MTPGMLSYFLTKTAETEIAVKGTDPSHQSIFAKKLLRGLQYAAGLGVGVGAGTLAGHYLDPWITSKLGLEGRNNLVGPAAAALTTFLMLNESARREHEAELDKAMQPNNVLLRLHGDDYERVRDLLRQTAPPKSPISVSVTSDTGPMRGYNKEVIAPQGIDEKLLREVLWNE